MKSNDYIRKLEARVTSAAQDLMSTLESDTNTYRLKFQYLMQARQHLHEAIMRALDSVERKESC